MFINNVNTMTMQSAGVINMTGGTISNAGNLLGSNLTISTGGNLTLTSSTGGKINATVDLNMSSNSISNVSGFTRILGGSAVAQPVTQYGSTSGTGANGSVVVTMPNYYTSASSYNVFITHVNSSPADTSVVKTSGLQFTIYWRNAGAGTQPFDWMAIGT